MIPRIGRILTPVGEGSWTEQSRLGLVGAPGRPLTAWERSLTGWARPGTYHGTARGLGRSRHRAAGRLAGDAGRPAGKAGRRARPPAPPPSCWHLEPPSP